MVLRDVHIGILYFLVPLNRVSSVVRRAWFVRNKIETCNISASRTMATGSVKNFIKYSDAELGV